MVGKLAGATASAASAADSGGATSGAAVGSSSYFRNNIKGLSFFSTQSRLGRAQKQQC
jgi:hypothetical protein